MKKTIWYLSKYISPAGAAKVSVRGYYLLHEFANLGHKAVLITSDSNHLATAPQFSARTFRESVGGVDVHWLRTVKYPSARSFRRMLSWLDFEWQLFRMEKKDLPTPDVLIVSSLSLLTILNGLLLRARYGCKLVFEVRDIWPLVLIEAGGVSRWNPLVSLLAWLEKMAYQRSDLIVGTMPNLQAHVREVLRKDKPVVCIPQGLDPALLQEPVALPDTYIESHIPKSKFIICHAGSIGADNALETLVSCARLMQDRSDIHFLIVGDGYLKSHFQEISKDLRNLSFTPRVKKTQVQSVLAHVDVVYFAVHKAKVLEFGQSLNKVIDYMYSAKPIIASYSGYPSMVNEAECGVYVPAEDAVALRAAIERFANMSAEERRAMGEKGREWLLKNRQFRTLASQYLTSIEAA